MNDYDYLRCSSCKSLKPIKEFYTASNDRGYRYYCIECEKEKREKRKVKQDEYYKKWYSLNKEQFKKKKISYSQDANIKMKKNVREFFINSVKNNKDQEQFEKTFGYSIELIREMEKDFKKGMRWGNLGTYWNNGYAHTLECMGSL